VDELTTQGDGSGTAERRNGSLGWAASSHAAGSLVIPPEPIGPRPRMCVPLLPVLSVHTPKGQTGEWLPLQLLLTSTYP
jgi:hypothetical protein